MEELSPLDTTFLELEQSDDASTMHIGAALVFDPVPGTAGPPSIDAVRALVAERMPLLPRFACRIDPPRAGGLHRPRWVRDAAVDLEAHVRHASLPAPGGAGEVREWLADFWSHPLDRARPLWETTFVDGLEGGRWMLATKTHHAMVDGVGSLDIGYALLDLSPDGRPAPEPAPEPATDGGGGRARPLGAAASWLPPVVAYRLLRRSGRLLGHPRRLLGDGAALAEVIWRDEVHAAPASSLNVPIGATRRFAPVTLGLEDVKAVKRRLGGTVNDVVLAVAAGGLRRLLCERGETPVRPLRAMVPVNVRAQDEQGELGNHVTSLFVELPVDEPDALRRYALTREAATRLKESTAARGGEALVGLTGLVPPALHQALSRTLFAPRLFNLTITNVPGPQVPLYMLGARLAEIQPLVPLFTGHAVGMAIVSYDGALTFGVNGDRAAMPDLDVLAAGLVECFEELREPAGTPAPVA